MRSLTPFEMTDILTMLIDNCLKFDKTVVFLQFSVATNFFAKRPKDSSSYVVFAAVFFRQKNFLLSQITSLG
jgi:16S rRNA A1518/A1519 N6-dimethyltransferase RsmA/KsgA/DIM1 with predicted DNA glycosylase/AP lyase activity